MQVMHVITIIVRLFRPINCAIKAPVRASLHSRLVVIQIVILLHI